MFILIADSHHGSYVLSWDSLDRLCWSARLFDALAFHHRSRAEQFGRNHVGCSWRVEQVTVH